MDEEIRVSRNLMKILSTDTRAETLKLLEKRPMTASELSRALNKHVTTVSEHLEHLLESNLVERVERPGHKWVYYKLTKGANRILHPTSYLKWSIVLALSFFVLIGSFVTAANSNPGDPLYGLKRFDEAVRLSVASSGSEKADLYLKVAEARLEEAKKVADKNDLKAAKELAKEYNKLMESVKRETYNVDKHGKEVISLLEDVNEATSKHISILGNIKDRHPELRDEIQTALDVSKKTNEETKAELEMHVASSSVARRIQPNEK